MSSRARCEHRGGRAGAARGRGAGAFRQGKAARAGRRLQRTGRILPGRGPGVNPAGAGAPCACHPVRRRQGHAAAAGGRWAWVGDGLSCPCRFCLRVDSVRVQELAGPAPLKAAFRAGLPEITSKDPDEPIFWVLADLFWPVSAFKDPVSSFKNRRNIKLISCAGFLSAGDGFKNHPAHIKNAPRDIFRSVKGFKNVSDDI